MEDKTTGLIILGVIVGLASSLLGIGGGLVLIPALVLLYHYSMKKATAISLATVVPIIFLGAIVRLTFYPVPLDYVLLVTLFISGVIGSWVGVHSAHYLDHHKLTKLFSLVLLLLALFVSGVVQTDSLITLNPSIFYLSLLGLVVGFISGLFGLSGGVVLVPILIQMFSYDPAIATTMSLVVLGPLTLTGAYFHHMKGSLDKHLLYTIVPSAFVGVIMGSYIAQIVAADMISRLFAMVLIITAMKLYFSERVIRKKRTISNKSKS